jgi:hypothetical protein
MMEITISRFTEKMEQLLEMERLAEVEESALVLQKYSLKVGNV